VFVLLGFEERSYDYLVIKPSELARRLEKLHGNAKRYQIYFWVTKRRRTWLTRNISAQDQENIAAGRYKDSARDMTRCLNDWQAVRRL
jgi:hypothetical protein